MPRVAGVSLLSRLASDLIINAFDTPWNPWGDGLGTSWKSYLTFFWKPVLQYLIFPAQFLFLYSYHPSGPMGDLPKKWKRTGASATRRGSEAAFAKAKAAGMVDAARRGSGRSSKTSVGSHHQRLRHALAWGPMVLPATARRPARRRAR